MNKLLFLNILLITGTIFARSVQEGPSRPEFRGSVNAADLVENCRRCGIEIKSIPLYFNDTTEWTDTDGVYQYLYDSSKDAYKNAPVGEKIKAEAPFVKKMVCLAEKFPKNTSSLVGVYLQAFMLETERITSPDHIKNIKKRADLIEALEVLETVGELAEELTAGSEESSQQIRNNKMFVQCFKQEAIKKSPVESAKKECANFIKMLDNKALEQVELLEKVMTQLAD